MKRKWIIILIILVMIIGILSSAYLYLKNPQITIPKYVAKEYNFKREKFNNRDVYVIEPKENKKELYILYQHGGTYTTNLTQEYWDFLTSVVADTGATIIIPDYPLTPEFYYKDVFDMMIPLYQEIITKVGANNLIVMGDSAGGGLSLALCQNIGALGHEQPKRLILISPWLDVSMENAEIDAVQEYDPLLRKDLLKIAGKVYARDINEKDYHISPIYGDLTKLKNISIFTGTYDILNPDAKKFYSLAKEKGVKVDYREYIKAIHIWLISNKNENVYQAKSAYKDLIDLINKGE